MSRIAPLSGYPEFLPAESLIEARVLEICRESFELHGFGPLETRAVEPLEQLARKGDITKEVYVVKRLHAGEDDAAELGLHYDLTVPFARYVLENQGKLQFPFRRYQIQKVWRGERPQEGRYREFRQADVDIVGRNTLAEHHDVEVVVAALTALQRLHTELGLPPVLVRVSNRKVAQGYYSGLGIADVLPVIQAVDKLDKIGCEGVTQLLKVQGLTDEQVAAVLRLAEIRAYDASFVDSVRALGVTNEQLETGLAELSRFVVAVTEQFPEQILVDMRIARGLDYYTGTVFELELVGWEKIGTVCAGGRYEALACDNRFVYPGVGLSIGITRILVPLLAKQAMTATRDVPTCVLVAVDTEEVRGQADLVARTLRARGIPVEVAPKADKFGRQIKYADVRRIPYVWFGGVEGEVKDIRSGEQVPALASTWNPPVDDLYVRVTPA